MSHKDKLSYTIDEFLEATGIGSRSTVYKEIKEGRLRVAKVGKRTLITKDAAKDWLESISQKA